jgi:hypothetical protein
MTKTDVSNSSRPHAADAAIRGKRASLRMLLIALSAALMLMAAFAASSFGASGEVESGYKQKPPAPKEAGSGTAPAKESSEPASGVAPESASASPTSPSSSSTLPFTGLDLRWVIGGGLLLIGSGASIRIVQRRERQDSDR